MTIMEKKGRWKTTMCNGIRIGWLALLASGFFCPAVLHAQSAYAPHDDLFSVSFTDENRGWACGRWGVIRHTDDGGSTWEAQNSGTSNTLSGIHFIDATNGWAVGKNGTILHTADGGKTWEKQDSPVDFFLRDVFFINPATGWIAAEETHILHTTDGGKTWEVQFSDDIYKLVAISFADGNNGWAVGEYGFTYHTSDGGRTWEHQAGYFRINEETGDIETGVFLFDVVAIDAQIAIAVGADSVVRKTVDGGKTWENLDAGVSDAHFISIAANSRGMLVIGGKGVYLISDDLGRHFRPMHLTPSMEYYWLYAFAPRGGDQFAAVGEEGAIYLSNSADNWRRINY